MDEARARLNQLGAARNIPNRFLYSAANPIGEECLRESGFSISEGLIDEVATEAAPWIDLWRDCYAFIANRVAVGLRDYGRAASSAADAVGRARAIGDARLSARSRLPLA